MPLQPAAEKRLKEWCRAEKEKAKGNEGVAAGEQAEAGHP